MPQATCDRRTHDGVLAEQDRQSVIGSDKAGSCGYLQGFNPFKDLTDCATVKTYVGNVIKSAVCTSTSSTCNSMLKAQMLATALDVYFTANPNATSRNFLPSTPIGPVVIDLDYICSNPGACGSYEDVSAAFGGASSMTVSQMLAYAASQSNVGGSLWYGQVKATQVLAKDAFDAINNQVAYTP